MAKVLKVAFIGCGGRNGAHVQKCMMDPDLEYVGFCDPDESRAVGYANRIGVSPEGKIFKDYKALLANIEGGIVFSRDGDVIWQCGNCGHIQIGKKAPAICPVCDHAQAYFRIEAVNY
jgi:hypothetical protein